jgi:hypothetical protein
LKQKPPTHRSKESKQLWSRITSEFTIHDSAGLAILRAALEARDRAEAARLQIEQEGMTTIDRFGIRKLHPLIPAERDNRAAYLQGLKQLNLDHTAMRTT